MAVLDLAPAHARAVLADAGDAVDAAHDVLGELGHEEHVIVGHDGNGAVAHYRVVMIADEGGGLEGCVRFE